jgi:hypothetical protein
MALSMRMLSPKKQRTTFALFTALPLELRLEIYRLSLPNCPAHGLWKNYPFGRLCTCFCHPLLLVCHESRRELMRILYRYHCLLFDHSSPMARRKTISKWLGYVCPDMLAQLQSLMLVSNISMGPGMSDARLMLTFRKHGKKELNMCYLLAPYGPESTANHVLGRLLYELNPIFDRLPRVRGRPILTKAALSGMAALMCRGTRRS